MASSSYKAMREQDDEDRAIVRKRLFEYCCLDTYAMYAIYSKLLQVIK
jgi:hypothetical protein